MSLPIPLKQFGAGDDNNYHWSTRLEKAANQFLLDIQSEFQLPNKSSTLRAIIQFAWTYLEEILEKNDYQLSEKTKISMAFLDAERETRERAQILQSLNQRVAMINDTDYLPLKTKLTATAQAYAELYGFGWPPPELPILAYDTDAKYVFDKIIEILSQDNMGKITVRDLQRRCSLERDKLDQIIERLVEKDQIVQTEEKRSGAPTVWLSVPFFSISEEVSF